MRANGEKILRLNTGNPAGIWLCSVRRVDSWLDYGCAWWWRLIPDSKVFSARGAIVQYCQLKEIPKRRYWWYLPWKWCQWVDCHVHAGAFGPNGDEVWVPNARLSSMDGGCQPSWRKCRSLYLWWGCGMVRRYWRYPSQKSL